VSTQYAFYFDSTRCTGCKACQTACEDKYDLAVGQAWRRVYEVSQGNWKKVGSTYVTDTFAYYISLACNHCVEPICVEVCPAGAITKRDDGIVVINQDQCIGCRLCEWACPYGAPQYNDEIGRMGKCTGCYDKIDAGEPTQCVAACPSRALDFDTIEALREKYGDIGEDYVAAEVFPLPSAEYTLPALFVVPNRNALNIENGSVTIANPEEV